ncbi:hypothetical protein WN55_04956 [Dufourea novaeangliae]|uniref:Uncharacterized protein n=1 Tax=Dufourea novaeangliae TaxID=178035 RepID=A0A154PN93_DUFNO|nr:hypothetical protein WN55_04956 [Dufourea novaeangliae]
MSNSLHIIARIKSKEKRVRPQETVNKCGVLITDVPGKIHEYVGGTSWRGEATQRMETHGGGSHCKESLKPLILTCNKKKKKEKVIKHDSRRMDTDHWKERKGR